MELLLSDWNACTRPHILYAIHRYAHFAANPKISHEKAIERIVKYLIGTKYEGIILNTLLPTGVECFVDANFAGDYQKERADKP